MLCGDNQDAVMMELLQGNAKITQLNTDPPYGVDYVSKNKFLNEQAKGNRSQIEYANDEINNDLYAMFMNICKTINWADYNTFYIFSAGLHLQELRMAIDDCGLKWGDYLIWVKNNHVLGRKDYNAKHEFCIYGWHKHHKFHGPFRTTLLEYDKPHHSDLHPTIKPIELISQLITDGTKEGDIVLDVFGGSGTTLIASEKTNRVCYMMEISPYFTSVIIERWELETGKKAKKIKS